MWLRKALFASISIGLALLIGSLIGELTVRWFAPQPLTGSWRTYSETGLVMNKSHGSAIHTVGGRTVKYEFAYPGIRVNPNAVEAKHKILLLGDSFTFGWGLNPEETYVAYLEKRLRDAGMFQVRLINAAAGGWGLDSFVRYAEEFGHIINPCAVIVFVNTDDVGRAVKNRLYQLDDGSLTAFRKSTPFHKAVSAFVPWYGTVIDKSHLLSLLRRAYLASWSQSGEGAELANQLESGPSSADVDDIEGAVKLAFALSLRLREWALKAGADLLFTTTGWHRPPYDNSEPTRAFMAAAGPWFAEKGIAFVDVSPQVQEHLRQIGEKAVIPGDGHPSAEAAKIIAENVWPSIFQFVKESRCVTQNAG